MSRPDRAVFRLPLVSVLIPFLAFVCITPLANAGAPAWLAFYLFPLAGLAYILITRTVADPANIRAMGLRGVRRIAWSELDGLEFRGPRWATAVALDGRRVRLPMVRPRDMYRLAAVSGGRLLIGKDAPVPEPEEETDGDSDAGREAAVVEAAVVQGLVVQEAVVQETVVQEVDAVQVDTVQEMGPAPQVDSAPGPSSGSAVEAASPGSVRAPAGTLIDDE